MLQFGSLNQHGTSSSSASTNKNKVVYAYSKQDTDELSINIGDSITLITSDTGSGWIKIKNNTSGETGLVPTTYVEIKENSKGDSGRGPAQGDDEISISAGDKVNVIKADDGNGWTYGEYNGEKGLFPTSYCK